MNGIRNYVLWFRKETSTQTTFIAVNAVRLTLLHRNHGCKGLFFLNSQRRARNIDHLNPCFYETSENKEEVIDSNFAWQFTECFRSFHSYPVKQRSFAFSVRR